MITNDFESREAGADTIPVSFKVIGTGSGAADIIEKVESFGYDCVGCVVAESPGDCIPADEDKMAIIVARDNEDVANEIAKNYHDADVLTIGLVYGADFSCYDSVATDARREDFPEIIKSLLQPIVTQGYICYDFNDLCTILHNSRFFKTLTTAGKSVEDAVVNMQKNMENVVVQNMESLSAHLYFNRERQPAITMNDMSHLSNMLSELPKSVNAIWSVNTDDTLPDDMIRFTTILSGKGL